MRILTTVLLLAAALVGVFFLLPTPGSEGSGETAAEPARPDRIIAIRDVRLFDGESVIDSATLVLADGRVESAGVGVEIPDGAEIVDGAGRTALPGLVDAHVHAFGRARRDAVRFGVTTMLDMFRPPDDLATIRAERDSTATIDRADLYSAGFLATAEGGHGTQYGIEVPTISTPAEADPWVAARVEEGSDWIKIVIENGEGWGGDLPSLDDATIRALVDAAHARNLLAVAHASTRAEALRAIAAGVDGLVHAFADAPADEAFLAAARDSGIFVVPTATVMAGAFGASGEGWLAGRERIAGRLSPEQRRSLAQAFPGAEGRTDRMPRLLDNIAAMHGAGVPLLAGSDAPNPGTAHGASLHHEMRLMADAGMAPVEVLRAATSTPARIFALDGRGCLQPGCRADVVLVDGNPLDDIAATADIVSVFRNGRRVELDPDVETPASGEVPAAPPRDLLAEADRWMAASDRYQGGRSTAVLEVHDDAIAVSGSLAEGFAYPYGGGMWSPTGVPMVPADLRGHDALVLRVTGSIDRVRLMLFSGEDAASQPFWIDLETGMQHRLEFARLAGVEAARIGAVGVFASDAPGDYDFRIERMDLE